LAGNVDSKSKKYTLHVVRQNKKKFTMMFGVAARHLPTATLLRRHVTSKATLSIVRLNPLPPTGTMTKIGA